VACVCRLTPMSDPWAQIRAIPPVTRGWAGACLGATVGMSLRVLDPYFLTLNWPRVWSLFEVWRPVTCFCFLGGFSLNFVFQMMFLIRYGSQLEGGTFQGRPDDYAYMLAFCATTLLALGYVTQGTALEGNFVVLGPTLIFAVLYVWARHNEHARVSIYGLITVTGLQLPWAFLGMTVLMGGNPVPDLIGILVGHLYFFLKAIHPVRTGTRLLDTPAWFTNLTARAGLGAPVYVDPRAPARPAYGSGTAGAPPRTAFPGRPRTVGRAHAD